MDLKLKNYIKEKQTDGASTRKNNGRRDSIQKAQGVNTAWSIYKRKDVRYSESLKSGES
jgi:hypothetical protein